MAYVKRGGLETGGGVLGSGGGVMGGGETTPAAATGNSQSAAGSPSGFYNIQDFLGANQGSTPRIQTNVEQKGNAAVESGKQQLQQNQGSLSALPNATEYNRDNFNQYLAKNEYDPIRQAANQSFTPTSSEDINYNLSKNISDQGINSLKPGDFGSVMNWFGQAQPTSSTYNPGMQKMDEMLLRGNKDFVQNFAPNIQAQYKSQVSDPLSAAISGRIGQEQATGEAITGAANAWKGGIGDYLKGQDALINAKITEQQGKALPALDSAGLLQQIQKTNPDYFNRLNEINAMYADLDKAKQEYEQNAEMEIDPSKIEEQIKMLQDYGLLGQSNIPLTDAYNSWIRGGMTLGDNPYSTITSNPSNYYEVNPSNASRDTALTALAGETNNDFINDYSAMNMLINGQGLPYTSTPIKEASYKLKGLPTLGDLYI